MDDQKALVEQIKADVIARGIIPVPQTSNAHSAAITFRVAWALAPQGAKLIRKSPGQNGYTLEEGPRKGERYSHDAISFPLGWVDVLSSAGPPANENGPVWQWTNESRPLEGSVAFQQMFADPFNPDEGTVDLPLPLPPLPVTLDPTIATQTALNTAQIEHLLQRIILLEAEDINTLKLLTAMARSIERTAEVFRGQIDTAMEGIPIETAALNRRVSLLEQAAAGPGVGTVTDTTRPPALDPEDIADRIFTRLVERLQADARLKARGK